jgi:hypothetical protein
MDKNKNIWHLTFNRTLLRCIMSETVVGKRLKYQVTGNKWGYETQVRLAQH